MAILTVTPIQKSGIPDMTAALVAADAAGDGVDAASGIFVAVANGDASSHTLTVPAPTASTRCGGYGALTVDDIAFTVAAGATGFFAVPSSYADSEGNYAWTYDDVTGVTVGVFSITP